MKNKIPILFLIAVFLFTSLPLAYLFAIDAAASESLGSITECTLNNSLEKITVRGSIKHSVLVNNRDSKIAVYRFDPWVNVEKAIKLATPLASMDMTITFEFELPCTTVSQRLALYAVALIPPDGSASLISDPQYVNLKTGDTSDAGFKGVATNDTAAAVASHAGSAIVDVYLDKLDNGNKSGYIFSADGDLFYFDRDVINDFDKKIVSYTASGCDVYLRFLISPHVNDFPFCTKGSVWATNKCIVVGDDRALNAIYAYTYFLISRYDGGNYGKVNGVIVGRGADMPILYNYASLVSEDYESAYSRSLSIIGLAAAEAAGDSDVSLIVPVGDSLNESRNVYAEEFLTSVADYMERYSKLSFTVMCESRHNPYKITDAVFASEIDPDVTGEDVEHDETSSPEETFIATPAIESEASSSEITYEPDPDVTHNPEETLSGEITSEETATDTYPGDETEDAPEERPKPEINTNADGYYCTDNIDIFINMFEKLKRAHSSVNDGFGWCWYPGDDTVEGALGVCYAYNYMALASLGADFYCVGFENAVSEKFPSIAHLFKYIDTADNIRETAYARSVFEISDWSEIIDGYNSDTGVYNILFENDLQPNVGDYVGEIVYLDYTSGRSMSGWYEGVYCNSLGVRVNDGTSALQAEMGLESAGVSQAEIGYMLQNPEPLLIGDALTFEVKCGDEDGSLYEIAVYINCGESTIVSKAVVTGGVKCTLSADVGSHDDTAAVQSIRISLKRVTGSGDCKLNLYRILINSATASNDELNSQLENIRDYLRSDAEPENKGIIRELIVSLVLLSAIGLAALLFAYSNDKKNRAAANENNTNKFKRGNKQ